MRWHISSYEIAPFFSPNASHATLAGTRDEWVKKPPPTMALSG